MPGQPLVETISKAVNSKKSSKTIRFFESKYAEKGEQKTQQEEKILNEFSKKYNTCLFQNLTKEEIGKIDEVANQILEIAKNSKKIEMRLNDFEIEDIKEFVKISRKAKKCKQLAKKFNKDQMKIFKSGMKKMKIEEIIKLTKGI